MNKEIDLENTPCVGEPVEIIEIDGVKYMLFNAKLFPLTPCDEEGERRFILN